MHDDHSHDHAHSTHSKKCDDESCSYVAETHAHDDDDAAEALARDLAEHNKSEHGKDTDPEEIKVEVKDKMTRHGH